MRVSLTRCAAVIAIVTVVTAIAAPWAGSFLPVSVGSPVAEAATTNVNVGSFWFCNSSFNNDATGGCTVTITEGDSVTWTNTSGLLHTATQCGASFENVDCPLPGGFDTGFINGGATSAPVTFNTAGEFRYRCEIHANPPFAMRGRIKVLPATPPVVEATKSQTDLNGGLLAPDDVIEYTVTLSNSGGSQADNAGNEYEDNIPANTSFVAASASASSGAVAFEPSPTPRIVWNGPIAGGGSVTIIFRVQVSGSAPGGALIRNQGVANYDSDGTLTNDAQEPTDNPATATADDSTVMTVNAPTDDLDGDGYNGAREVNVGTSPSDRCGSLDWPSDVFSSGASTDQVTIQDAGSFIAPVPRLGTSPPDTFYSARWDLNPGPNPPFPGHISVSDIGTLLTGSQGNPPMFGGAPAFLGPPCSES